MSQTPLVSVVLPVYNASRYIGESIKSVLKQTFEDFELIVIDDGSTDNSLEIINSFAKTDSRVRVISRENRGLIDTLNEGISAARGEYIARMDADDICLPERFERQITYMQENSIDLCGASVQLFNDKGELKIWEYPLTDQDIKFTLLFVSAFAHPVVMIRKEVFDKLSYPKYQHAEDYKLWVDIAMSGYTMGNINEVLLRYRVHDEQVSNTADAQQQKKSFEISQEYMASVGLDEAYAKLRGGASSEVYEAFCQKLQLLKEKNNVSDKHYIMMLRHTLRFAFPLSLSLFFVYLKYASGHKRDLKNDFYLLVQTLFILRRGSFIYNILKRFV